MCDLPQKTVKYRAFCLWIVFGLDAGKCQLIRTMWIQFFLSKDENAVLQWCINRLTFRLLALDFRIGSTALIKVFMPIQTRFVVKVVVHILAVQH